MVGVMNRSNGERNRAHQRPMNGGPKILIRYDFNIKTVMISFYLLLDI